MQVVAGCFLFILHSITIQLTINIMHYKIVYCLCNELSFNILEIIDLDLHSMGI